MFIVSTDPLPLELPLSDNQPQRSDDPQSWSSGWGSPPPPSEPAPPYVQPYGQQPQQPNPYGPYSQPQQPYGQQPPPAYPSYMSTGPQSPSTPPIAIVAFIASFLISPVGLILSFFALSKSKAIGAGKGLSIAALVISILGTLASLAVIIPLIFFVRNSDIQVGPGASEAEPAAAVVMLTSSYVSGNCDDYMNSTTSEYRDALGASDCEEFAAFSDMFNQSNGDYSSEIISSASFVGFASVEATETGTDLASGDRFSYDLSYTLVQDDSGSWRVQSALDSNLDY